MLSATQDSWAGIEGSELDKDNFVKVDFRWVVTGEKPYREYFVGGKIRGEQFSENFGSPEEDNKRLAYDLYWEKLAILENGCIYCVECENYATNPEFANAVSQTSGYCLDCVPSPDNENNA